MNILPDVLQRLPLHAIFVPVGTRSSSPCSARTGLTHTPTKSPTGAYVHYYQFNIGDYASHTRHLSLLEDLAYRKLLDQYYLQEQPLNACSTSVARLIGMREYQAEVDSVLKDFFTLTDDGWIQSRADREISAYRAKIEQASKAGKASAIKRAFNAGSTDVQPNSKHKPITINQEEHIKPLSDKSDCPNCPAELIVEAYHETLPTLRRVVVLSEKRKALVRQRWRECFSDGDFKDQETGIDAFRQYFGMVARSDFLCGRVKASRPFQADFEWLMNSSNFIKVIEGKYNGN